MTYRIFVSHTKVDSEVAQAITNVLNNAFEGNVHLYLASREVIGGEEWKKELKKELKERDAIICVITPESVRSPWLFIEWSAFWIADKRFYLLISDEIRVSDLVQPMQDRQMTLMQQKISVINLFRGCFESYGHVQPTAPQRDCEPVGAT
ncbi:MAG TPA: TIR domain-containing protein [Anaerolineae bacterium]|nr:TIR domain-containing protein [Anaerolineae bacterium]